MHRLLVRLPVVPRAPSCGRAGRQLTPLLPIGCAEQRRSVTVWPQWPYDEEAHEAKLVGDLVFRWPPKAPPARTGEAMTREQTERERLRMHRKIFQAMAKSDWGEWERGFVELRDRNIPFDESTYSLLLHGYTLSHRHPSENAYMVLEEMKCAEIHPALIRMNQRFLDASFEFKELGVLPPQKSWQNLARLCLHSSVRFKKKRRARLKRELLELEPDDVLRLGPADAQRWISGHDRAELPPPDGTPARFLTAGTPHPAAPTLLLEGSSGSGRNGAGGRRRGRRGGPQSRLPGRRDVE